MFRGVLAETDRQRHPAWPIVVGLAVVIFAAVSANPGPVMGQPGFPFRPAAPVADTGDSEDGDFPGSTALKTDPELERLLERADQFAATGRYDLATVLWQRVLDESGDTLMSRPGWTFKATDRPYQKFKSVCGEIERTLSELPPVGRKVYRLSADGEAKAILATGREGSEEQVLAEVVRRLFLSSHGDDAAFKLACLLLDRYDFVGASRLLAKVLDEHPDATVPQADILLRLAVADARVGDVASARKTLARLQGMTPRPERAILDLVRREIESAGSTETATDSEAGNWHLALGSPARNGRMRILPPEATRSTLTELWSRDFGATPSSLPNMAAPARAHIHGGFFAVADVFVSKRVVGPSVVTVTATSPSKLASSTLIARWKKSGWFPTGGLLMDRGRIYFRTHNDLTCCDAASGEVIWRSAWQNAFQLGAMSQMRQMMRGRAPAQGRPSSVHETMFFGDRVGQSISISGDVIYSVEGKRIMVSGQTSEDLSAQELQRRRLAMARGQTPRRTRRNWMAAYDIKSGKSKWYRDAHDTEATANYEIGFLAAPTPYGRLLLVPVSDSGAVWLYALNREDGKTVWKTFLCDEPPGGASLYSPVGVAVDGGDAYVATGCGVVFALDAMSGSIHWAVRYRRSGKANPVLRRHLGSTASVLLDLDGWDEDVVIPHGRQLVVLASDYNQLFALDRRTGEFIWDSPRTPWDGDPPGRYCLGLAGDGLFVAGTNVVRCYSVRGGRLQWQRKIEEGSMGRGVLTENAIYVPVKDSVAQLDLKTGQIVSQVGVTLPAELPVGNLFSDGEKLLVLGLARVYALTNLNHRLKLLAERIEAGDPEAYMVRMRLHGRMGNMDEAVADLVSLRDVLLQRDEEAEVRKVLYESLLELKLPELKPKLTLTMIATACGLSGDGATPKTTAADDESILALRHQILNSTLHKIRSDKVKDTAESVLLVSPLCDEHRLLTAARRAMAATAGEEDAPAVRAALQSKHRGPRIVATSAVPTTLGKQAGETLRQLLADEDELVCLEATRALANTGDPACLPVLGKLLESQDLHVRADSGQLLRGLTGKRFSFAAYDKSERRAKAAKAWQEWIAKEGKTAKLHYPVREQGIILGRTLICYYSQNKVVELDANGNQVWQQSIQQPWSAQGLPNGHRLITSYSGRMVVEYDATGKEVWKKTGLRSNPSSARRLANGNTLISLSHSHKVIEINQEGETVWDVTIHGQPMDARRLEDGRTLVALQGTHRVVEIDREGKVVWEVGNMSGAFSAQRLPTGNTLVALTGNARVVEIDRDTKRQVWSKTGIKICYDAQRLPNGNTLIAAHQGAVEVDPEGNVVWERKGNGTLRVHRY